MGKKTRTATKDRKDQTANRPIEAFGPLGKFVIIALECPANMTSFEAESKLRNILKSEQFKISKITVLEDETVLKKTVESKPTRTPLTT